MGFQALLFHSVLLLVLFSSHFSSVSTKYASLEPKKTRLAFFHPQTFSFYKRLADMPPPASFGTTNNSTAIPDMTLNPLQNDIILSSHFNSTTTAEETTTTIYNVRYADNWLTTVTLTTFSEGFTTIIQKSTFDPELLKAKRIEIINNLLAPGAYLDTVCRLYVDSVIDKDFEDGLYLLRDAVLHALYLPSNQHMIWHQVATEGVSFLFELINLTHVFIWPELVGHIFTKFKQRYQNILVILNEGREIYPSDSPIDTKAIFDFKGLSFENFDLLNSVFTSISCLINHYDVELIQFAYYLVRIQPSYLENQPVALQFRDFFKKFVLYAKKFITFVDTFIMEYLNSLVKRLGRGWNVPVLFLRRQFLSQQVVNNSLLLFLKDAQVFYTSSEKTLHEICEIFQAHLKKPFLDMRRLAKHKS
jgi:hypothetical protein